MTYFETIRNLTKNITSELVDFSQPRDIARTPTQASSNFITNKEQGDWAERLILNAINENSHNYVAVKYGKSDDLVAGEEGFDQFFQDFQDELDSIGKRPDILIFNRQDFIENLGHDISHIPHGDIDEYVKKAVAGIEVRSSAFLIGHYEEYMQQRTLKFTHLAMSIKDEILNGYSSLLNTPARKKYLQLLESLNSETIHIIDFKAPGWRSSTDLIKANTLLKQLNATIKKVQQRDYLSITPKVEDLKVVYKWIETFNVPHFYFQVFFDKIYGISFENILKIISNPNNEDVIFSVESDTKNQNKTTIKIKSNEGIEIASKVDEPSHKSVRKEMERGRLLFYVTFNGGCAYLNAENLKSLLNLKNDF